MSDPPFRIEQHIRPFPDGSGYHYTVAVKRDALNGEMSLVINSSGDDAIIHVEAWTEVRDAIDAMTEFADEQDRRRPSARQG